MQSLFTRLLGVFGIHAALGVAAWFLHRALFLHQDGLSADLLTRLDGDPARADAYVAEAAGNVLTVTAASLLLSAVLAGLWLVAIHRNPPIGDRNARSRRGSWAAMLLAALAGAVLICWLRVIGAAIADLLAPGVPAEATLIVAVAVLLSFWISTALFAPASTRVAVPGAGLLGR